MRQSEFLELQPATPEHILAIIRDSYRHARAHKRLENPDLELGFETRIADWLGRGLLSSARLLGHELNSWFGTSIMEREWERALAPAQSKTLADLCRVIARHKTVPVVQPFPICGTRCLSAGAFLTVRSVLHRAGVPTAGIRPSTPLAPYARDYYQTIVWELGVLAPGALPVARIEDAHPGLDATCTALIQAGFGAVVLLGALLPWLLGRFDDVILWSWCGAISALAAGLVGGVALSKVPPKSVTFSKLHTFRDLAEAVAMPARAKSY